MRWVREPHGFDPGRKLLVQISRFDRLKDRVGGLQAYGNRLGLAVGRVL